jgi:hypothetical protein
MLSGRLISSVDVAGRYVSTTKWLYAAAGFHVLAALVLAPVTSHPYDLAVLMGNAQAWLNWGFSPFYNWKFGIDYAAMAMLAQALRAFLGSIGVPGVVAIHIAWKLPLVLADLLTAGAIYRLALRLAPERAVALAALWLVNPVLLWVSAGHGQVESLAILSMFATLSLALDGRLFLAGVVTGFGGGIEYFPVAAAGTLLVWWRGGHLRGRQPLLSYGAGLVLSLAVCFVPLLFDPIGRPSLIGGLAFSGGFTSGFSGGLSSAPSLSLLTVWAWLDYRGDHLWPLLFATSGIITLGLALRYAKSGLAPGFVFLSVVLLAAVLLDANALPQFAVIAGAALWILALVVPANPLIMVAAPAAGIATYFFYLDQGANTANAFFYDDWATIAANLVPVPPNPRFATFLGHLFSLGLIVSLTYALVSRARPRQSSYLAAGLVGAVLCLLLAGWALQPAIWSSAFASAPSANVPAFEPYVATKDGTMVEVATDTFRVSYSDTLIQASRLAAVEPSAGLRLSMPKMVDRQNLGGALPPGAWHQPTVIIPDWQRSSAAIQTLWVRILVGSRAWTRTTLPNPSSLSVDVKGIHEPAVSLTFVSGPTDGIGWAYADFQVPSAAVDPEGRMELLPSPSSLVWNGSAAGPWVQITPASGTFETIVDAAPFQATFHLDPAGQGYAVGFPLLDSSLVTLERPQLPTYEATSAVLHWSTSAETWKLDHRIQAVGLIYALTILVASAWVSFRYLRLSYRRAPGESVRGQQ